MKLHWWYKLMGQVDKASAEIDAILRDPLNDEISDAVDKVREAIEALESIATRILADEMQRGILAEYGIEAPLDAEERD